MTTLLGCAVVLKFRTTARRRKILRSCSGPETLGLSWIWCPCWSHDSHVNSRKEAKCPLPRICLLLWVSNTCWSRVPMERQVLKFSIGTGAFELQWTPLSLPRCGSPKVRLTTWTPRRCYFFSHRRTHRHSDTPTNETTRVCPCLHRQTHKTRHQTQNTLVHVCTILQEATTFCRNSPQIVFSSRTWLLSRCWNQVLSMGPSVDPEVKRVWTLKPVECSCLSMSYCKRMCASLSAVFSFDSVLTPPGQVVRWSLQQQSKEITKSAIPFPFHKIEVSPTRGRAPLWTEPWIRTLE